MKILIVDDESLARINIIGFLRGHEIVEASTYREAVQSLKYDKVDLAFLDLDLGDDELAGLKLAKLAKEMGIYSIVTTGHGEIEITKRAYEMGAQDYLQKRITPEALNLAMGRYNSFMSGPRVDELVRTRYLTTDKRTIEELNIIKGLTRSNKPVLLTGPTGTGKTIIADIIREICNVPKNKFVSFNCGAVTESLLESKLFGHKKGSFTGATENQIGLLKEADGGIIFLDEIHALSKTSQLALMKAVEEKTFLPVGATKPEKSDFRVICATCEDLPALIEADKFRADFYARVSHIKIELFPLKERTDDIIPLIYHFNEFHKRKITITEEAEKLLRSLEWKSNTRDIEAIVEDWTIKGYGIITPECISEKFRNSKEPQKAKISRVEVKRIREMGIKDYLESYKKDIVEHFLELNDYNKSETARELQVTDYYIKLATTKKTGGFNTATAGDFYENSIQ